MSDDSQGFHQLNKKVQQWIWKQNWPKLHLIQEQAIPLILKANCDVIISAATAAGKTEAAFLPACSRLADGLPGMGIRDFEAGSCAHDPFTAVPPWVC